MTQPQYYIEVLSGLQQMPKGYCLIQIETINILDTRPGITSKKNHPRSKTRKANDDVSTRIRSKTNHIDQNVGITIRSKLQGMCNLSVQDHLFPLHDAIALSCHRTLMVRIFKLGISECKMYLGVLMKSKSQIDFDSLRHLHILHMAEEIGGR